MSVLDWEGFGFLYLEYITPLPLALKILGKTSAGRLMGIFPAYRDLSSSLTLGI